MAAREYGQFCGLARALELVGERWALLLVRDLLVGPRRFTDLRHGLPRIPTNILAARLKEMEGDGIVRRRVLPRPSGSVVYELTDFGRDLEAAVAPLARWGARALGEPRPREIITTDSMVMALRTTFRPPAAEGVHVGFELRLGEVVLHAVVDDGALEVRAGPLPEANLVIESGPGLRAVLAGEIAPSDALATRLVSVQGDSTLLDLFASLFHIDPAPVTAPAA